jgi:hypothetical protein
MPFLCHATSSNSERAKQPKDNILPFRTPFLYTTPNEPGNRELYRRHTLSLCTPFLYTLPLESTRPTTASSDSRTGRRWRSVGFAGKYADFPSGDMPPGESYSVHGYNDIERLRCVLIGCGYGARGLERRTRQRSSYQTIHSTHLAGSSVVLVAMSWFLLRRHWSRRRCSWCMWCGLAARYICSSASFSR